MCVSVCVCVCDADSSAKESENDVFNRVFIYCGAKKSTSVYQTKRREVFFACALPTSDAQPSFPHGNFGSAYRLARGNSDTRPEEGGNRFEGRRFGLPKFRRPKEINDRYDTL